MNGHKILSIAVVLMLTLTVVCTAFVVVNEHNEGSPSELTATAVERDKYGDCVLDIDTEDVVEKGYKLNDYIKISWNQHEVQGIVVTNYVGLFTYEYFINIPESGNVSIGCQFAFGSLNIGDKFIISYIGPSHREDLMPNYSKDVSGRTEGMTDEEYANYRNVSTTGIGTGILYRSYNGYSKVTDVRAGCVDPLLADHSIAQIINMNESMESLISKIEEGTVVTHNGQYYIDNGKMFAEYMSIMFIEDDSYKRVFEYIADNEGPYLVFCSLGKDRTGFVMTMLEALMGASYDEMFEDYCRSYECLYGVEKGTEEYDILYKMFNPVLCGIHDPRILEYTTTIDISSIDVSGYNYQEDAENFLSEVLGISDEKIGLIRQHLSGPQ